jgi:hypothetical protein
MSCLQVIILNFSNFSHHSLFVHVLLARKIKIAQIVPFPPLNDNKVEAQGPDHAFLHTLNRHGRRQQISASPGSHLL